MPRAWSGPAALFLYRSSERRAVTVELEVDASAPPGRAPGWRGAFSLAPFTVVALGKGLVTLANGREAEVMVEGFDVVTGRGYFFGTSEPPF